MQSSQSAVLEEGEAGGGGRPLFLSPPLCFVFSKIGRIPTDDLKDIMAGFYNAEQILSARDTLQAAVASKKIEGGPTFRGHRMSSGTALLRDNKNLDDLLVLTTFLDERGLINLLPRYVADNPDTLPSSRLCEGELLALLKKMNTIEEYCMGLQAQLATVLDVARSSTDIVRHTADVTRDIAEAVNSLKAASAGEFPSWNLAGGGRVQQRLSMNNTRPQRLESELSESEGAFGHTDDDEMTMVQNRNTRRKKRPRDTTTPPTPPVVAPYLAALRRPLGPLATVQSRTTEALFGGGGRPPLPPNNNSNNNSDNMI